MRNLKHSKHQYRLIKKNSLGPKMYRPREKYYGIAFEFDPYDDDDHPSVPHGDSYNHYYKLDLRNDNVYAKREKIGHLKEKEFEKLQHDKRIKNIIVSAQNYYRTHHPEISFDPIPWCSGTVLVNRMSQKAKGVIYQLT